MFSGLFIVLAIKTITYNYFMDVGRERFCLEEFTT